MYMRFKSVDLLHAMLLASLLFSGCQNSVNKQTEAGRVQKSFSVDQLKVKWEQQDTLYIQKYIAQLDSLSLSDRIFFDRVVEFSNVSGFVFGNTDIEDENWHSMGEQEKLNYRRHIAWVYSLYSNSPIFMKEGSWENSQRFQNWYQNEYDWLSNQLPLEDAEEIISQINNIR